MAWQAFRRLPRRVLERFQAGGRGEQDRAVAALSTELVAVRTELAELRSTMPASGATAATAASDPTIGAVASVVTDVLWWSAAPLGDRPLVSCVLPVGRPDRGDLLRGAVESVQAQTYPGWELLVVDDGIDPLLDPLPAWWPDDDRVHVLRSGAGNVSRARNAGLACAAGAIVAYLDDDCRWFPWWLHAVVHAFTADPELAVAHGVRVVGATDSHGLVTFAEPLDPITVQVMNPVDTNVLAHRADLAEAYWDESIEVGTDYELVIRLAALPSRFVPVPAATYGTASSTRTWATDRIDGNAGAMRSHRASARRRRPLRVVAHNAMFPLRSETYIGDELEALRRHGMDIVLSRAIVPPASAVEMRPAVPLHESLTDAVAAHDPDLILTHWATNAPTVRAVARAAGIPFAVRRHSFDGFVPWDDVVTADCIGAWSVPVLHEPGPRRFALPTLVIDPPTPPARDVPRSGVLVVSAGLPKRGWPMLMEAVARSVGAVHVVVARTDGHLDVPATIARLAADAGVELRLDIDVDHATVLEFVRRAAACVYTIAPDEHWVGQPRSVLEAALCATPVVVPAHESMRDLVGECAHTYARGDAVSLADAIDASLRRPAPYDVRTQVAERLRRTHGSDDTFEAWTTSLTRAYVDWRTTRSEAPAASALRFWAMR